MSALAVLWAAALMVAGSATAGGTIPVPVPDGTAAAPQPVDPAPADPVSAPATVTEPVVQPPAAVPVITPEPALHEMQQAVLRYKKHRVRLYVRDYCHWQSLMGRHCGKASKTVFTTQNVSYLNRKLSAWHKKSFASHADAKSWMEHRTIWFNQQIRYYSTLMGGSPPRLSRALASSGNIEYQFDQTRRRYRQVKAKADNPPHKAAFLCIHHYEGSWTDDGAPYYGGLQMDLGFQRTYAPRLLRTKGTANNWTPLEQIWTAEKAARSRGFWPWPNTARDCGLLG